MMVIYRDVVKDIQSSKGQKGKKRQQLRHFLFCYEANGVCTFLHRDCFIGIIVSSLISTYFLKNKIKREDQGQCGVGYSRRVFSH